MAGKLLTQNAEMRQDGIWNWTLPAWAVILPDGRRVNVCPHAGACVRVCYARYGSYVNFPTTRAAHLEKLRRVMDELPEWEIAMSMELTEKRFIPNGKVRLPGLDKSHLTPHVRVLLNEGAAVVRIHDSGDFFTDEYLQAWLRITRMNPQVLFYAYTKEIGRFKALAADSIPENFLVVYSMGGKQDDLIDKSRDRHADVFPTVRAIREAGYYPQVDNDLLAAVAPSIRIGVPQNNIPVYRKRLDGKTFAELEVELRERRASAKVGS